MKYSQFRKKRTTNERMIESTLIAWFVLGFFFYSVLLASSFVVLSLIESTFIGNHTRFGCSPFDIVDFVCCRCLFSLSLSMHIINRFYYEPPNKKTQKLIFLLYIVIARGLSKWKSLNLIEQTAHSQSHKCDEEKTNATATFQQVLLRSQRTMTE